MTGDALLARIHEAPGDTAARLVYADWLLERDEPRGELIHLQCKGELDAREQQRERGLLRAHAKRWLGPISAITDVRSRDWDRGFLRGVRLENGHFQEIRDAVGHPEWRMVRALDASCNVRASELVVGPVMHELHTLTRLHPENLAGLAMSSSPLAIEELEIVQPDPVPPKLRGPWPGLPRLRVLGLGANAPDELAWLADVPIDRLTVQWLRHGELEQWLAALGTTPWKLRAFGIGQQFVIERDETGRFGKLTVRCHDAHDDGLISMLATFPPRSLTQLVLEGADELRRPSLMAAAAPALAR